MSQSEQLPEGTDRVLDPTFEPAAPSGQVLDPTVEPVAPNAAEIDVDPQPTGARARLQSVASALDEKTAGLRSQAADKARAFATDGKDRAVSGLGSIQKLIDDAAATIDDKVGPQYGDYARKASETVSGLASTLQGKEIDDLIEDAREAVRKSPALAIGAAAALGFIFARLVKAGTAATGESDAGSTNGTAA